MAKTILVVDDKESLRILVKSYLVQEGFRVVVAKDGHVVFLKSVRCR